MGKDPDRSRCKHFGGGTALGISYCPSHKGSILSLGQYRGSRVKSTSAPHESEVSPARQEEIEMTIEINISDNNDRRDNEQ